MNVFRPAIVQPDPDTTRELDAPSIVESLIREAEQAGASDIHLQSDSNGVDVAFRLDGVMAHRSVLPREVAERLLGRIKFLARLKTYQDSLPQDGRIDAASVNAHTDIRVATYPTVAGEKIVLRLFNNNTAKTIAELAFPRRVTTELETFLSQPAGMLLLTGPAGSGKTTTIYACLRALAQPGDRHIITIEDPVEQIVPGVMQTEVSDARGLDFAKAARHLLRQDPQALIIGEIRDEETANIAVRAALTGHLVISTLHAGSCLGVLERLLVMCADRSAISASLPLIFNQRLMRKLCRSCSGRGCEQCMQTGYRGRVPVVESLRINDTLREHIRANHLQAISPDTSLEQAAHELVRGGITDVRELRRVLGL